MISQICRNIGWGISGSGVVISFIILIINSLFTTPAGHTYEFLIQVNQLVNTITFVGVGWLAGWVIIPHWLDHFWSA